MKRIILILSLFTLSAMAQAPAVKRGKPSSPDTAKDQQAMAALNKMAAFLGTLKTFSVTSQSSRDEIVDTNMKIQKNALNNITVQLPDRLNATVHSDDRDLRFIYDGKKLTLFSAKHNYYATTDAPPTVQRTLDAMRARFGIVFPLADFIAMASGENLLQDATRVGYIGTSRIDQIECDHIAVRQPDADWQVWIERGQTPLPRKLAITSKTKPTQPQYVATLTWDLTPDIEKDLFVFTPPADAVRIKFARTKNSGSEQ